MDKSVHGVLGTRTWGSSMEGADKSTDPWWHPQNLQYLTSYQVQLSSVRYRLNWAIIMKNDCFPFPASVKVDNHRSILLPTKTFPYFCNTLLSTFEMLEVEKEVLMKIVFIVRKHSIVANLVKTLRKGSTRQTLKER